MSLFFMKYNDLAQDGRKALLLIMACSITLKFALFLSTDIINPDAVRYVNSAHEIFRGNWNEAFNHEKMLGFTFLLGLVNLVCQDWYVAGKLLSAVPLLLTTIPLYLVARQIFGPRAALATGLLYSTVPFFNNMSTVVVKDPLFLLCVISSLWMVLRGLEDNALAWWLPVAGLLSLISMLFRVEGIVYLGSVLLVLLVFIVISSGTRDRHFKNLIWFSICPLLLVLSFGLAFVTGALPIGVWAHIHEKFSYYFTLNLFENYQYIYQHLKSVELQFRGGQWTNDFFEFARHQMLLVYLVGLLQLFIKALFPIILVPLVFGLSLKKHWNRPLVILLVVLVSYLLMDYLFLIKNNFLSKRYLMMPVVMSFVLAGYGLDRLLLRLEAIRYTKAVSIVVLLLCFVTPAVKSFSGVAEEKQELKAAGEWLKENRTLSDLLIITDEERVMFYADLLRSSYVVFPSNKKYNHEQVALKRKSDLIVLGVSVKRREEPPVFKQYKMIKAIKGLKKKILVYERKR